MSFFTDWCIKVSEQRFLLVSLVFLEFNLLTFVCPFFVPLQVPDGATIKVLSKKTHPPLSPQGSVKGKS